MRILILIGLVQRTEIDFLHLNIFVLWKRVSDIARKIQKHFWLVTTYISGLFNHFCHVHCYLFWTRIQESKIRAVKCWFGSKTLNLWCRSRAGCWRPRPCTSPGLHPLSLTTSSHRPSYRGTASHPGICRSLSQPPSRILLSMQSGSIIFFCTMQFTFQALPLQ